MRVLMVLAFLCIALSWSVLATLSKDDKKKPGSKEQQVELSAKTVVKRGLVVEKVKATEIIKEHQTYCDTEREIKHFPADTLAYVTPWNSHGYDVAKMFSHKFTYVSPVWLQIQRRSSSSFSVLGAHDIDKEWMTEVSGDGKVQIVPRVLFDGWTADDYTALFSSEAEQDACSRTLIQFLQRHRFDGMVLEVWSQVQNSRQRSDLVHLITHIGEDFQAAGLSFIVVLPPPIGLGNSANGMVMQSDFESIAPFVSAISLMTYDFSHPQRPGPNSPIDWVKACIEYLVPDPASPHRRKILLGLNFYGNDYVFGGGGPIVGNQSQNSPLRSYNLSAGLVPQLLLTSRHYDSPPDVIWKHSQDMQRMIASGDSWNVVAAR